MPRKKKEDSEETIDGVPAVEGTGEAPVQANADDASPAVEAATDSAKDATLATEEKPKRTRKAAPKAEEAKEDAPAGDGKRIGKRAEKIGIVTSDKMTKTVVVRVDRLVKHPVYRKYVRKRKKFMAHDEQGAKIGDKVKIVETRPLSARKRWRVVEIIQKAEL